MSGQERERAEAVVVREALKELTAARLRAGESPQTAMPKARAEKAAFTALLAENERLEIEAESGSVTVKMLLAEKERLKEALDKVLAWASRMPDAGFNSDSPRWDWWTEGAAIRAHARDAADTEETT